VTTTEPKTAQPTPPDRQRPPQRPADRIFSASAKYAGVLILVVLAAVATFLLVEAWPALSTPTATLTDRISWLEDKSIIGYVGPLVFGTVLAALVALVIATPIAIGVALFISHYAPRRVASGLGYVIDLLAAIPSVVYGLWGVLWLMPRMYPVSEWLSEYLGWIPLFAGPASNPPRTILAAGIVLAVMILPIITAVSREIFLQTPTLHEEAALALGATRWEMIRTAVLPFARSGIISATMLGLGRALGETMAVAMVLSATGAVTFQLLTSVNPSTIAANIALSFPEAYGMNVNVLIATGLILFVVTFAVNAFARWIVSRRKEFSGAN
jgi:phosphate transport system permease protein